jgi:hypothetical protein
MGLLDDAEGYLSKALASKAAKGSVQDIAGSTLCLGAL